MKLKKIERDFVSLQRVLRFATVDESGMPHNVPVCHVMDGDRIYFATEKESNKVKNLTESDKVALICDEYSEVWSYLRGVSIHGKAKVIHKGPEFRKASKLLYQKYRQYEGAFPIKEGKTVIVEVTPEKIGSWGL
jgi:nitroimidazol reductase NimA-like FMN-containing flavoprotein (pyridoxamine 5'-phosphate oxidase superfamily)